MHIEYHQANKASELHQESKPTYLQAKLRCMYVCYMLELKIYSNYEFYLSNMMNKTEIDRRKK